ncbi:MAG: hypothetical protein ACFFED_11935, partial [Candidatus Thorarchaeota archaeon]
GTRESIQVIQDPDLYQGYHSGLLQEIDLLKSNLPILMDSQVQASDSRKERAISKEEVLALEAT